MASLSLSVRVARSIQCRRPDQCVCLSRERERERERENRQISSTEDGFRYSSIVELFDDGSQGVAYLNVEFALCDTGFCTTNGDNLTASCGCLSMRPTEKLGELVLGWAAAVFWAAYPTTVLDLGFSLVFESG